MSIGDWTRIAVIAGFLLPIGPNGGSASAADGVMRLHGIRSGHVLWLRASPSPTAKKVGFIPAWGRNIRNLGCSNDTGWCRVRYRGTSGWAPAGSLRAGAPRLALG